MSIRTTLACLSALAFAACGGATTEQAQETTPAEETYVSEAPVEEAVADPEDVHIEGDRITFDDHINFASDSDEILSDSDELLDHIALLLSHHTSDIARLRVIGHTDAAGGHEHNQDLSERRAAAVVRALEARGVSAQLESSGAGESEPLCEEDTDECHARNRRVELLIVPGS